MHAGFHKVADLACQPRGEELRTPPPSSPSWMMHKASFEVRVPWEHHHHHYHHRAVRHTLILQTERLMPRETKLFIHQHGNARMQVSRHLLCQLLFPQHRLGSSHKESLRQVKKSDPVKECPCPGSEVFVCWLKSN